MEENNKKPRYNRKPTLIRNENGGQSAQEGLEPDLTRFTCIAKVKNINFIRDYAYTKGMSIKDTTNLIIEDFERRYKEDPTNEPLLDHKEKRKAKND